MCSVINSKPKVFRETDLDEALKTALELGVFLTQEENTKLELSNVYRLI